MKIRILSTPDSEYVFKKGGVVKYPGGGKVPQKGTAEYEDYKFWLDSQGVGRNLNEEDNYKGYLFSKGLDKQYMEKRDKQSPEVYPINNNNRIDFSKTNVNIPGKTNVGTGQFNSQFTNTILPYTGKDAPSKYSEEQWSNLADQTGFVPKKDPSKSVEQQFQEYLYSKPEYKPLIDNLHKQYGNPSKGMFDANLGKRWDSVYDLVNTQKQETVNNTVDPNIEKLSGANQPEYKDSPLNPDEYKPTVKPTFGGDKFDYSQIVPEGLALINDPGIKTWTRKSYINEVKPTTLNVQAELNENQADSYYAIGKNVGNPAVNKSVISQIVANKYAAANNKIYEAKNNFDTQSLNQANNINNQNIERLDEVNYGRAKKQFDERDIALENQYARKNEIFNSLSGKLASYKHDQSTKKLWFDLLSKNYDYSKGEFTINPETGQPWINPDIVIKSKESTKKTK